MIDRAIESFRAALAPEPAVRAILLAGSHATGLATAMSDIDITVLVPDDAGVDAVKQRLAAAFEYRGEFHEVPVYGVEGGRVALCCYPHPWLDDWVGDPFRSAEHLLQWQGFFQHKIIDAVEISDPHGFLARYRACLEDYPDAVADEIARGALAALRREFLDDWNFRNPYHYAYRLQEMLEQIGIALFARNRRFYAPPLKHWQALLPTLEPDVSPEVDELVAVGAEDGLAAKREALARLVERMTASG